MLLVLDNGSAYSKHLISFMGRSRVEFTVADHTGVDTDSLDGLESVILSGRRTNNREQNRVNSRLVRHAASEKIPMLGICYGAEIMAITLGGTIGRMHRGQFGIQPVSVHGANPLCEGRISVFESHSYEIRRLGRLESLASSESCRHELVRLGPVMYGTQFHPEMSDDGRMLITRFCRL